MPTSFKALSLFSSAGIGELGIKRNDIEILAANELLGERCELYKTNHPETEMFSGDIWELTKEIVGWMKEQLGSDELFLIYATPPCQGMSTNGSGKLKSEIEAGRRPPEDERNRLVIPAMDVICELNPKWVLFENVPGMKDTVISTDEGPKNILSYIQCRLGSDYVGRGEVLECSDYGIPQLRRRLITIFTRDEKGKDYFHTNGGSFFPDEEKEPQVNIMEAIAHLPELDAVEGMSARADFHPLHYVSVMSKEKYWWVANTPEGDTAFNNQCVNSDCLYDQNPRHFDHLENGKWVSSKTTPIYCEKCGSLLPRPTIVDPNTGKRRLIKGFHSAYRRMKGDQPARALTRNFPFEASDNKIHPTQNRVLSVYEALVVQTIADYEYHWEVDSKPVTRTLIAQAIGESVPPRLIDKITKKLVDISCGNVVSKGQLPLLEGVSAAAS